jgi:hypothetical protein
LRGGLVDEAAKVVALGQGFGIEDASGQVLDVDASEGVGCAGVAATSLVRGHGLMAKMVNLPSDVEELGMQQSCVR